MTSKELNDALYDKMSTEMEKYKGWLLTQPAEEILHHTYEYTMKQDILESLEHHELDYAQAQALLGSPTPLEDVYGYYNKQDCTYMETIWESIQGRAGDMLTAQKALPVYNHSGTYAHEHGELEAYRASRNANIACRDTIDDAISRHYNDNSLHADAVTEVIDSFGFERTMYILANTVRQQNWDGRYSSSNKKWAQTIDVCENPDGFGSDRQCELVLRSHPGLINIFTSEARHQLLLTLPLTSEEVRQEAERLLKELQRQTEPNSPSGTHYMAKLSEDFMARASSTDTYQIPDMFQIKNTFLSNLKDRPGLFFFVPKDADRSLPLRKPRASVRAKLHDAQPVVSAPRPAAKDKGMDR